MRIEQKQEFRACAMKKRVLVLYYCMGKKKFYAVGICRKGGKIVFVELLYKALET